MGLYMQGVLHISTWWNIFLLHFLVYYEQTFVMYWLSFLNELLHNDFAFNRMIFFKRNNPFSQSSLCGHDVLYCKRPKALRVSGNPFFDARRLTVQVLCLFIMPFVCVLHIFFTYKLNYTYFKWETDKPECIYCQM